MEHDGDCEREAIILTIDRRMRLSRMEKLMLRFDVEVEICFCWERQVSKGDWKWDSEKSMEKVGRAVDLVLQGRGPVTGSEPGLFPGPQKQGKWILLDRDGLASNVIPVDFRNRRRIDR